MQLSNKELMTITGGAFTSALIWKLLAILGTAVVSIGIFDGFTNPIKCRKWGDMMLLSNIELIEVTAGVNLSGSLISAFTRGITVLLDLGRSLGSSIRRVTRGRLCPI